MKLIVNTDQPHEFEQSRSRVSYRYDVVLGRWRKTQTVELTNDEQLLNLLLQQSSIEIEGQQYQPQNFSIILAPRDGQQIMQIDVNDLI